MTNKNYIQIQGWMINDLRLKSNELLIYALIYGFSQDGSSRFTGSLKYICDALCISRNTVISTLKKLTDKNLIEKTVVEKNNVVFNEYSHIEGGVHNLTTGGAETDNLGGAEIAPNKTTLNNTKENKIDFPLFLDFYNKTFDKKCRVINDDNKKSYRKLLKTYKKEDIINAMKNAKKDTFHLDNGFKYLTIEYFSRSKTIDRFGFIQHDKSLPSSDKVVSKMDNGEFVNF